MKLKVEGYGFNKNYKRELDFIKFTKDFLVALHPTSKQKERYNRTSGYKTGTVGFSGWKVPKEELSRLEKFWEEKNAEQENIPQTTVSEEHP